MDCRWEEEQRGLLERRKGDGGGTGPPRGWWIVSERRRLFHTICPNQMGFFIPPMHFIFISAAFLFLYLDLSLCCSLIKKQKCWSCWSFVGNWLETKLNFITFHRHHVWKLPQVCVLLPPHCLLVCVCRLDIWREKKRDPSSSNPPPPLLSEAWIN